MKSEKENLPERSSRRFLVAGAGFEPHDLRVIFRDKSRKPPCGSRKRAAAGFRPFSLTFSTATEPVPSLHPLRGGTARAPTSHARRTHNSKIVGYSSHHNQKEKPHLVRLFFLASCADLDISMKQFDKTKVDYFFAMSIIAKTIFSMNTASVINELVTKAL